jgi:hypothetical protein
MPQKKWDGPKQLLERMLWGCTSPEQFFQKCFDVFGDVVVELKNWSDTSRTASVILDGVEITASV